jgi:hypothetical protein
MATTTNYSWDTPDDTDLVKDGAAAIRTLGSSIDTTTKALNPSTTLGDIEYRSGTANTNTRLGIGSTGQVLTVAGGVPSWATPAGGTTFVGCSLKKSASQSIADNVSTAMTWDQEVFDTDGFHSTVTNTDRITIPAGKGGYYLVTCVLYFNDTDADTWRDIRIFKNGANHMATRIPGSNQSAKAPAISDIFALAAGDYIQAYAVQASGASVDVYSAGDQVQTRFAVAYLGA